MSALAVVSGTIVGLALTAHVATSLICFRRCGRVGQTGQSRSTVAERAVFAPPVSILRPVKGLTDPERQTLLSSFQLDYPAHEVIVCAASRSDPAVAYCQKILERHPTSPVRIIIGPDLAPSDPMPSVFENPKIATLEPGWKQRATTPSS